VFRVLSVGQLWTWTTSCEKTNDFRAA
jgi:hypothetical protein